MTKETLVFFLTFFVLKKEEKPEGKVWVFATQERREKKKMYY